MERGERKCRRSYITSNQQKHKMCQILTFPSAFAEIWTQPTERLREYLMSILERLRIAKLSGVGLPLFMDKSNIASMFEMLDSSNKGSLSSVQYKEALKTLGLCTADEVLKDDGHGVTFKKFRNETKEVWV
ncbi:hypothetical protein JEQ12_007172 [Ovis aries]|uniref:EF-hand domain-containing protein n=1 Tax=Ovis aries TaxID=9940 RepID=A0A835ZRE9_SHEEP|nr:hypothetical protein JEQ12_007172 [Ovis aries]